MTTAAPLLDVRDLRVEFGGRARPLRAVDGVSFRLSAGESVAIVGESGSGKSVTALALMGLLPASARLAGQLRLQGDDLAHRQFQLVGHLLDRPPHRLALFGQDLAGDTVHRRLVVGRRRLICTLGTHCRCLTH